MIRANIHQVKTHLSKYLAQLETGETILICKRNIPIAEIIPVQKIEREKRPVGLAKGEFQVPDAFFEPLPEDLIKAFGGQRE